MTLEIVALGGYSLSLPAVGYLVAAVVVVVLGPYPLLRDEPLQESLFFFLLSLAVAIWLLGFGWAIGAPDPGRAMDWIRLAYFGVPVIPPTLYTVAVHTLGIAERRRPMLAVLWTAGAVSMVVASSTDIVIEGVRLWPWGYYPVFGPGGILFIGFVIGGIGAALGEYALSYRRAEGEEERRRIVRYLVAFGIGSLAAVDFMLCYGVGFYPVGYALVAPVAGLMGHTIRKHHLSRLTPAFAAPRIMETMTDLVLVCDERARIRVANAAAEAVLGYAPDALTGLPFEALVHPDERRGRGVSVVLQDESFRDREVVLRCRDDDGAVLTSLSASALSDQNGRRVGSVLVIRDIRERKAMEEQLRQAQKMEAVGRLAGGVAHDFNNLLTVIHANTELLGQDLSEDDEVQRSLSEIVQAVEQAKGVTGHLLTLGRKTTARRELLDLNEVVHEMQGILNRLLGPSLSLRVDAAPAPAQVEANRTHMEQVVLNLVINARDAMPDGGTVHLRIHRIEAGSDEWPRGGKLHDGAAVLLAVTDAGEGMDERTREQVFDPFFTTKEEGKGTGLGLSIVHGIVSEVGGVLEVDSTPGKGTEFRVYLPSPGASGEGGP